MNWNAACLCLLAVYSFSPSVFACQPSSGRVVREVVIAGPGINLLGTRSGRATGRYREIAESLTDSEAIEIDRFEFISSAVYRSLASVVGPPKLFQEVVVLIGSPKEFRLIHAEVSLAEADSWRLASTRLQSETKAVSLFKRRPANDEIGQFLMQSEFGNNHLDDSRILLEVLSYHSDRRIVSSPAGVSASEYARRYSRMAEQELEKVAPDKF